MAENLGMTKAELLDRMSSYEISEWIEEFRLREKERKKEEQKAKGKRKSRR